VHVSREIGKFFRDGDSGRGHGLTVIVGRRMPTILRVPAMTVRAGTVLVVCVLNWVRRLATKHGRVVRGGCDVRVSTVRPSTRQIPCPGASNFPHLALRDVLRVLVIVTFSNDKVAPPDPGEIASLTEDRVRSPRRLFTRARWVTKRIVRVDVAKVPILSLAVDGQAGIAVPLAFFFAASKGRHGRVRSSGLFAVLAFLRGACQGQSDHDRSETRPSRISLTQRAPAISKSAAMPSNTPAAIPTIPPVDMLGSQQTKRQFRSLLRNCINIDKARTDPLDSSFPSSPLVFPAAFTFTLAELTGLLTTTAAAAEEADEDEIATELLRAEVLLDRVLAVTRVEPINKEGMERVSEATSLTELVLGVRVGSGEGVGIEEVEAGGVDDVVGSSLVVGTGA
jgi:hypothetical protein